ncbi:MAG: hypothetical protein Q8R66_12050, partial [Methanobacteriaceae archaeon]|nr:hypothetical protein [Methanobacteriaceae archaeon]
SSQGPGVYDVASGVWDAGLLLVNDSVSLDLVLQVLGAGCFNHVVDVYDNLNISNNHMVWSMICASVLGNVTPTVINSSAFDGLKPNDNGNGGSGSGSGNSGSGNGGNGGNGGGSGGAGGSGNGGKGGGNGGGSDGGDGGSITPDNTPKTQLQRDIHYIRDFTSYTPTDNSQDSGQNDNKKPNEPPKIPEWTLDPFSSDNDPSSEELNDWASVLQKFSVEFLIICAVSMVPNDYIRNLQNSFMNSMSTLYRIAEFFGQEKKIEKAADLMKRAHSTINRADNLVLANRIGAVLDGLGPNLGMKYLEVILKKLFPGLEGEITMFLNSISVAQFVLDPFGTLWSVIDAGSALFTKYIPKAEDINNV